MGEFTKISKISMPKLSPNILVGPSSVIPQWEEYFKLAPTLNVKVITKIANIAELEDENINDFDVLLVLPSMCVKLLDRFEGYAWKRFIYDEPNSTEIPGFKKVYAGFTWFITATYEQLTSLSSRSRNYLNMLFRYMDHEVFNNIIIKNPDDYVKQSFRMPDIVIIEHKCFNPQLAGVLRNHVSDNIIEMINAGDIQNVIRALGGHENSNIVELVTKKHKEDLKRAEFNVEIYRNREGGEESEMCKFWKTRVEEFKKKIADIEERFKKMQEEECPICRCDIETPVMIPCCQHIFCGGCLMGWCQKNPTCPMCRHPAEFSNWVYLKNNDDILIERDVEEDLERPVSKPETIVRIINKLYENKKDAKIIIFSSWDESFNIISRFLSDADIDFHELKGHVSSRKKIISNYKSGKAPVLFLNSRFNGAGINLQETTDIILYHDMPTDIKTQIIGRANRIGRKQNLNVHILN
jgi:hypothetical protein